MGRTNEGDPKSKIRKTLEKVIDAPVVDDLKNVQTGADDYARNKGGIYGGKPEVRQPSSKKED